jgi:polysaccharide export outer membrane protein
MDRASMTRLLRRVLPAAFLALSACATRQPLSLAPLPDRPWTVLPGDAVRVRVYREPDLSGEWPVNTRGQIFLPGLGRYTVAGLTADSLSDLLSAMYAQKLVNSVVDVGILRKLPVLGSVRNPMTYLVEPTMTVQQLLGMAGGVYSNQRNPLLTLRKGRDGTEYRITAEMRLDRLPLDEGDAIQITDPNFFTRNALTLTYVQLTAGVLLVVLQVFTLTKK